jgi:hypothetical protein
MGVKVTVGVALGSGVILGKGVRVIVGISVARTGVKEGVREGAAVNVAALAVEAKSGVAVAGAGAGDKSTRQAVVKKTVAKITRRGRLTFFIAISTEQPPA